VFVVSNVVFGLDKVGKEQQLRMVRGASLLGICVFDHEKVIRGEKCTKKCATVWDGSVSGFEVSELRAVFCMGPCGRGDVN
jgi:hypothetical protein